MRRIAHHWIGIGLILSSLVGCQTVPRTQRFNPTPTAAIGYTYRAGFASQSFAAPEPEVLEATLAAMEDLSIHTTREPTRTGMATRLDARAPDSRRVRVDLKVQGEQTIASVQVGLFGDEPLSKALLDRMGIRLGMLPAEPIPDMIPSEPEENPVLSRDAVPDSVMLRGFTDSGFQDSAVP